MSIIEVTYYEVACDEPGCGERTSTAESEFTAWFTPAVAVEQWEYCDGQTIGGRHFCCEHRKDGDDEAVGDGS